MSKELNDELFRLSSEIGAVANALTVLSVMFTGDCDRLNGGIMRDAIYSYSQHLERVCEEMDRLEVVA